jgi:Ca2+:H+ antiporter
MHWIKRAGALNLLLVMVPVALALRFSRGSEAAVFICSGLAIIPLAGLMGRATEMLADRLGAGWGGLLNATFGNAAELIIGLLALRAGLTEVVKASITGSILGNVLLVLGASFFAGGLRYTKQKFNSTAAGVSATLMLLAAVGLLIPAIFHFHVSFHHGVIDEQALSLEISVVLISMYALLLVFSLRTHKHLYTGDVATDSSDQARFADVEGHWPMWVSLSVLLGATVVTAVMSEQLVGSIEATRKAWGLTEVFVGVIVVAIVGNAAEHSTAVLMAMKNRMELGFQIAVGSGLQVALFVAPVLVFAGYLPGFAQMNLVFTLLEVVAVFVSVLVVGYVASDGESNWLEGLLLLAVYLILAIAFFNLPEETESAARLRELPALLPC